MTFEADYAMVYDLFHQEKNYQFEIANILKLLPKDYFRTRSSKILDYGCGTGIHLQELGKLGFEVVGYDFSPAMIEKARLRAGSALVTSDFSKVGLGYGLAVSLFDVVSYQLSHAKLSKMLSMIFSVLNPRGRLIVDSWQSHGVRIDPPKLSVREASFGGSIFERTVKPLRFKETREGFDGLVFELEVMVFNKSKNSIFSKELHQVRTWSVEEIAQVCAGLNLKVIDIFNPKNFGKSSETDWRVGLVIEKLD